MKALLKKEMGFGHMELDELPIPEPVNNQVQIRVVYSGICGTDIHTYKGEYAATKTPVVLGHEFSGIVSAIGPKVTSIKVGDRVTSETTFETCGMCPACLNQEYNLCSHRKGLGTQVDGAMAEYVVNREESVHVLPNNVPLLSAALTEPLACGVHAVVEKANVQPGSICVVFGAGTIGQVVAQMCKYCGSTVIMAGLHQDVERFAIAQSLGIDCCVDQQNEDLVQIVQQLSNGQGADYCFECSGAAPALNTALVVIRRKGTVIQEGIFAKHHVETNLNLIMNKEIVLEGSRTQKPSSWITALECLGSGAVNVNPLITAITPLTKWQDAFNNMAAGRGLKTVFSVGAE